MIQVLDKGWVELQSVMGTDSDIVAAARVSYLGESKGEAQDKKLLFYLMRNEHGTPFEMAEVKIRIRAPVITFWQMVRHRTFNLNLQSGRYTPFEEDDFYVPSEWRLQSKDNKQASEGHLTDKIASEHFTKRLIEHQRQGFELYKLALTMGIAKEEARLFLPAWGSYYTGVVKCDVRNWLNFCRLRMHEHAQYEIRVYAETIYEQILKPNFPWTCEAFELYHLNKSLHS
jgi:thymidylate synthase (FAD)